MKILGINAHHADSAACLVVDGRLIAAAEEERFRRVKHWAGFPAEAVRWCLGSAGLSLGDIDHVAVNRDPSANLAKKVLYAFSRRPSLGLVAARLKNAGEVRDVGKSLGADLRANVHRIEHHRAHLASAFFVSPFDSAAVVSVDGFGDFASAMWGLGDGNAIGVKDQVNFPHSLGLFYLAMTQFLGFRNYGDEYKVMGLAAYGRPSEAQKLRRLVKLKPRGRFELELDYFLHHSEGVSMVWDEGQPRIGTAYSPKLEELLGPARPPDAPVEDRHKALAASLQAVYEEAFFHLLNHVHALTSRPDLCLAGGCAMNSVANGKIFQATPFKRCFVQPAAGDAGGAIGAAFSVWHEKLGNGRSFVMDHANWGPEFGDEEIGLALKMRNDELKKGNCRVEKIDDEERLCRETAQAIADGQVVGWFQGRMEWGPRALGNRSIVCDPRRADMKDILNLKIKRRESFRPFAPSVLREKTAGWFEADTDVPFMLQVYPVRPEKRPLIPAVTHVDGSGRLQTVTAGQNPLYHRLIAAFDRLTGVPMVLNTSFNENEPIVRAPAEALECFLRTQMDRLVLGRHVVSRPADNTIGG